MNDTSEHTLNPLAARERALNAREKLKDQKEKELNKKNSQHETSKACIIGLESRIKELEFTNTTLQQINNAMQGSSHENP